MPSGIKSRTTLFLLLALFALYVIVISEYIFSIHLSHDDLRKELTTAQRKIASLKQELSNQNKTTFEIENYLSIVKFNLSTFLIRFDLSATREKVSELLNFITRSFNQFQCKLQKDVS